MKIDVNNIKSNALAMSIANQCGEELANLREMVEDIFRETDTTDLAEMLQATEILADIQKKIDEINEVMEDMRSVL